MLSMCDTFTFADCCSALGNRLNPFEFGNTLWSVFLVGILTATTAACRFLGDVAVCFLVWSRRGMKLMVTQAATSWQNVSVQTPGALRPGSIAVTGRAATFHARAGDGIFCQERRAQAAWYTSGIPQRSPSSYPTSGCTGGSRTSCSRDFLRSQGGCGR